TFDEARPQFPVLERTAYLNAGTNGPLAGATVAALLAQAERDLREGRSGKAYFEQMLALREQARQGFADVLGVEPSHIALVESTTRGCTVVLTGFGLTAEDEVVTTDQEHFGLIGPLHASGARVVLAEADEDAILGALLREHVQVVTPPGHSTLVSFRPPSDPAELVRQLEERGVIVRELPGRNLVRVSCGWWTSAGDLDRLVDGVLGG